MLNFFFESGLRIFERLFETFATGIVFPTVIGAADTVVLDKAIVKGCAPVGTMFAD
jgi:hypothetical protein